MPTTSFTVRHLNQDGNEVPADDPNKVYLEVNGSFRTRKGEPPQRKIDGIWVDFPPKS